MISNVFHFILLILNRNIISLREHPITHWVEQSGNSDPIIIYWKSVLEIHKYHIHPRTNSKSNSLFSLNNINFGKNIRYGYFS